MQKWCVNNNMVLNPNKTTCMLIGTKNRLRKTQNLDLKTSDSKIENVRTQKLLGVYIESTLSWKIHVNKTCANLSTELHLLKRIKCFLTPQMQQTFYNSYLTPYFDYGCVTWSLAVQFCMYKPNNRTEQNIIHLGGKKNYIVYSHINTYFFRLTHYQTTILRLPN